MKPFYNEHFKIVNNSFKALRYQSKIIESDHIKTINNNFNIIRITLRK